MDASRGATKRKPTPKLQVGWRFGRKKRRQHLAATMIQKCFRSYLLRKAFHTNRGSVAQSFQALRAFHRARDRTHWRTVDLRTLKREELRLVALSLNLPSTGKKVLLLGRIQRWVDQHLCVNDLAGDAAAKALEARAKAQGSVYFCEAYPGAEPIDIRPLRGKGITSIAAGADSDAVYAVDSSRGALWLCKTGGLASQVGLCSTKTPTNESSAFDNPIESRWLVNPMFMHTLRTEHVVDVKVARSHAVALAQAGELFSWGENPHGELGFAIESADAVARNRATVVAAIATYRSVAVAVGHHHTIAVCDEVAGHDGVTFSWGSNSFGQLGTAGGIDKAAVAPPNGTVNGSSVAFPKPFVMHQVELLRAVQIRQVACGAMHSMALSADGKLYSWGCNDGGRLGHGPRQTHEQMIGKPAIVRGCLDTLVVLAIACGTWHSACIATDVTGATSGRVFTWGTGIYGQLGAGGQQVLHEPHCVCIPPSAVVDEELVTHLACGMHHTAVLTAANRVYTWGSVQRFSAQPQQLAMRDGAAFDRIASIACGRTFVVFNTVARDAASYEAREVQRLWRVRPMVIPRLALHKVAALPLSSSVYDDVGKRTRRSRHPPPPPRLEPHADRKAREAEELREAARIDAIDIDAIVHPLCRVCWRCNGFQPSPLKLWMCRYCYHEKQLHGVRPRGAPLGEYEAVRKIQCLYRARKARRLLQHARERHYQRVFSIAHDEFFYYDLWRNTVSWDRPREVGPDIDVPIRDPDALPMIKPPLTRAEAVTVLQRCRRGAVVRRAVKKRLARMYEKHWDADKERVYYVVQRLDAPFSFTSQQPASRPQRVLSTPPALLRRLYDLGEPIEIQRLKRFAAMTPDDAARVLQTRIRAHWEQQRVQRVIQSRYKRILDDVSGQFYYYNTVTMVSTWDKPRLLRASNAAGVSPTRPRKPRKHKFASPDAAARTIQAMIRRYACRTRLFDILSRRYRKFVDAVSGAPYYYDTVRHSATWIKPSIFGAFDLEVSDTSADATNATATSPMKAPTARKSTVVPEAATSLAVRNTVAAAAAVPHMSERARVKRHKRRLEKLRQMSRDDAASRLQCMWRARRARDALRKLLVEAYEQIYDPATAHYYYYNTRTGVVKWEKPWLLAAEDVRVRRRIKRRRGATPIVDPHEAARVIQGFVRYCGARNALYRLLIARIDKVWDPQARQFYYFDRRTGQSSWNKPLTLRHNDVPTTNNRPGAKAL